MELVPYAEPDLWLTEALETDPEVMGELGGPRPRAELAEVHQRRVRLNREAGDWWLKIVPGPTDEPAGTIGIWPTGWEGAEIHEVGWMVLPAYQGRGIASAALAILLDRARSAPRLEAVHAFPGTSNQPSNALCRKFGFQPLEECEVEFRDRALRVNHWVLAVGTPV